MKVGGIAREVLDRPVSGVNLAPGTLSDQLGHDLVLLVFLRHFGCMFCRETLADMREAAESDSRFPQPLFVFEGSSTQGRAFLRRYWPDLRAIADPAAALYEAFGVERGSLLQTLGPAVWSAKKQAEAKGHQNGDRSGDIWRMPGVFLIRREEILWKHDYRHAADHPDYGEICEQADRARAASAS